jgi:hypothetical protein
MARLTSERAGDRRFSYFNRKLVPEFTFGGADGGVNDNPGGEGARRRAFGGAAGGCPCALERRGNFYFSRLRLDRRRSGSPL